ncbi:MAG TPA: phosphodiester glycosidase family protein [Ktedonobacteraceae bacterium]|nr:phosphodiester glycosidase family protein [Ktedonobacteraceae bacterium]
MPAKHTIRVLFVLCLLVGSLLACSLIPNVSVNGTPVVSSTPGTSQDTPTLNRWLQGSPGVEVRAEDWKSPGNNEDIVSIVRIDLHKAHLQVAYQPDQPLLMSEWMKQTNALAIINGGYFDTHNRPTGLLIADGQTYGTSYSGFGGMLAVDSQGNVTLRSLSQQPYDPNNEQLQQATQSAPMLMLNGKRTQFSANAASSRRSVVAVDKQGRLLLIVSPNQAFSLDELADLLASSDLSIQTALNLDGGASTGLYVHAGSQQVTVDPLTPLPIVIVVK